MALPASAAVGLGLSAVTSIGGLLGQNAAAKRARRAALDDFRTTVSDLGARREEERRAAGLDIQRTREDAFAASSAASLSGAERGIAGLSVDLLKRGINADALGEAGIIRQNLGSTERQIGREIRGAEAKLQGRMNAAQGGSPLVAALGIARTALSQINANPSAPDVSNPNPAQFSGSLGVDRIPFQQTLAPGAFDISIRR